MERIEEIKEQVRSLNEELYSLEEKERDRLLRSHVGHYFKYRNCYSCPKDESERWWLYAAVFMERGLVKARCFQIDKDGKLDIEDRPYFLSEGWIPISRKEFSKAFSTAKRKLANFEKLALPQR